MERRTGQVVSEIPLDQLVVGDRYTITYIDNNFERDGGDRIKTFRGTLETIQIWPERLDGRFGARAGDRFFHFENTSDFSSGNQFRGVSFGLHEALIIRVEKYNIAPYGIPGLSKKINEYIGGRKKRRRKRTKKRRKKKTKKRGRKKKKKKKTKRRR
tara:strand:- start:47 stop:517 length:471 start_codon:yes stop_codon:yes gene_type:complete